jgi:hypothetical protein
MRFLLGHGRSLIGVLRRLKGFASGDRVMAEIHRFCPQKFCLRHQLTPSRSFCHKSPLTAHSTVISRDCTINHYAPQRSPYLTSTTSQQPAKSDSDYCFSPLTALFTRRHETPTPLRVLSLTTKRAPLTLSHRHPNNSFQKWLTPTGTMLLGLEARTAVAVFSERPWSRAEAHSTPPNEPA